MQTHSPPSPPPGPGEPLRPQVVIEAPIEAMSDVLLSHPEVRALLDNRWVRLMAIEDRGRTFHRDAEDLTWHPVVAEPEPDLDRLLAR